MPTATKTKVFNDDLFKKRVRLFDSDNDGERNLAFAQALRQCVEQAPPLKFYEAAAQAFGADKAERDELLDRLARALVRGDEFEKDIARLEEAGETLANALTEQQEINAALQETTARLQAELRNRQTAQGGNERERFVERWRKNGAALRWLFGKLWPRFELTWPNVLTLALGVDIAIVWMWRNVLPPKLDTPLPLLLLVLFRVGLSVAWVVSTWRREGREVLLVKSAVWVLGWWMVVLITSCVETGSVAFDTPPINRRDIFAALAPTLWWHPLKVLDNAFPSVLIALSGLFIVVRLGISQFSEDVLLLLARLGEK